MAEDNLNEVIKNRKIKNISYRGEISFEDGPGMSLFTDQIDMAIGPSNGSKTPIVGHKKLRMAYNPREDRLDMIIQYGSGGDITKVVLKVIKEDSYVPQYFCIIPYLNSRGNILLHLH